MSEIKNLLPEIECSQETFNEAIIQALYSLDKSHEGRISFLAWAEKRIKEEYEKEKAK